ncbi:MAG: XynC protein [Bacteroidetes bacterium]|nr:MAG: XynC protein [Bacteroidota bacterium]
MRHHTKIKLGVISLFLIVVSTLNINAGIDTLYVNSVCMNKEIPNLIILPDSFNTTSDQTSIIYLLHGAGGDFGNWMRRFPELQDLSNELNQIIVCPDGSKTSWYIDSPEDPNSQYESYIINDLVPTIDSMYTSSQIAITGLSMGGHGALFLALRHPEIFDLAGSMSGGVDLRPFEDNWNLTSILGTSNEFPERWKSLSVVGIVENMSKPSMQKFIFDCGIDDFFLEVNRSLDLIMTEKGIDHIYSERPGTHDWNYWRVSIIEHLLFFNNEFIISLKSDLKNSSK